MLTNNCRSLFRSLFCASGRGTAKITDYEGETQVLKGACFAPLAVQRDVSIGGVGTGVRLGSGTTPAKKTDYCLEAPLTVGSLTHTTANGVDENGKAYALYTIAYTNTSTDAVRIGEMGIYGYVTTKTGAMTHVLIDRTLLDSPITLAAGESCAIRYRLTNQFTV